MIDLAPLLILGPCAVVIAIAACVGGSVEEFKPREDNDRNEDEES